MANFSPSNLVAGQALFTQKFLSGEWRLPDNVAISTSTKAGIANPLLRDVRTREDRAVNAYFPIRQAATGGTARAHDHTGARGDSQAVAITWSIFSEPFSISIKQADNNVYSFEEMWAATMRNGVYNLIDRIDAFFVSQLLADKTNVNAGGGNGSFETGAGPTQYDYTYANTLPKDFFFQNVKAMMENNLYRQPLTAICDSQAWVLAQKNLNQGTANSINEQFQFMGYDFIGSSTRTILDVPTTYTESVITYETGLVAALPWIPKQNRKPLDPEKGVSYNGDYGQMNVPELDMDIAIHTYAQRADNSAVNGETQDLTIEGELSVDVGYVSAPLSDFRGANDSVVYTSGILA